MKSPLVSYQKSVLALFFWMGHFRFRCWSLSGGSDRGLSTNTLFAPIQGVLHWTGIPESQASPYPCWICSSLCHRHLEIHHAFSVIQLCCLHQSSFSILLFVHSLCMYSSSTSFVVSVSIVVWESMTVLRVYDDANLVSVDIILVIPNKPPLFFPVAFSQSVFWSGETWLERWSEHFTTKLSSWNSMRTSGERTDISTRYAGTHLM